jgi:hypothetical protein
MVTCQLMMAAVAAIKRFDSHLLHWWASVRERVPGLNFWRTGGEAEY